MRSVIRTRPHCHARGGEDVLLGDAEQGPHADVLVDIRPRHDHAVLVDDDVLTSFCAGTAESLRPGRGRGQLSHLDTSYLDVDHASMASRIKRTYNLNPATVALVRDLAARQDVAASQDAVIEMAVEVLARTLRDRDEAAAWVRAATDGAFHAEMAQVAVDMAPAEQWPDE